MPKSSPLPFDLTRRDLTFWFNRRLDLPGTPPEQALKALERVLKFRGFAIAEQQADEAGLTLTATLGTRAAWIIDFIPYIGPHLRQGKRFCLKVGGVAEGEALRLTLSITPWIEWFNEEEMPLVTQSSLEKLSDDFMGASELDAVVPALYRELCLLPPRDVPRLRNGEFLRDWCLLFMVNPFASARSKRTLVLPPEGGPKWSWPAFVLGEINLLWNDLWGAAWWAFLLGGVAYHGLYLSRTPNPSLAPLYWAVLLLQRILCARFAPRLRFIRWGRWN